MKLGYIFWLLIGLLYAKINLSITLGDLTWSGTLIVFTLYMTCILAIIRLTKSITKRSLYFFGWYRRYKQAQVPNRIGRVVFNHITQLGAQPKVYIDPADLNKDSIKYLFFLNLLLDYKLQVDSFIEYISDPVLHLLNRALLAINDCNHKATIPILEDLKKKFGLNKWLYTKLRSAYIKTDSYAELDRLNQSAGAEYAKHFGPDGINEGKIMQLKDEYLNTSDLKRKLSILHSMHTNSPSNIDYLIQYTELLRNFGQFDNAIRTILNAWNNVASLRAANSLLGVLECKTPRTAYDLIINLKGNDLATKFLITKSAIRAHIFDVAQSNAIMIMKLNPVLGHILRLEIARALGHSGQINEAIDELLKLKLDA